MAANGNKNKPGTAKRAVIGRGKNEGSAADVLGKLEVGQTLAMSDVLEFGFDLEINIDETIKDTANALRSTASGMISRFMANDLDDKQFRTVSGKFLTDDCSAIVVSVVILRTR